MFLMLLWVLITNAIIVAGLYLFNNIKIQVYTHFTQVVVNNVSVICNNIEK